MVGSYEDRGFSKEGRNARRKGKERLLTKQTETPFANKKKTGPKHMGSDTERGKIVSPGGQTKGNLRHDLAFTGDDSWDSDEESWSDQSESDTSDLPAAAGTEQTGKKSERKHLEQIKTRLGLTDKDFLNFERSKKSDTKGQTVSTAAGKPKKEPEVIVFEDPTARNRKRSTGDASKRSRQSQLNEEEKMLDMRRAKFDVHQFAIHGMTKEDKESAQIAHAIKLGAKPKKKPCVNYKLLMQQKKLEKEAQKEKLSEERNMGYKLSSVSSQTTVSSKNGHRKRRRPQDTLTKDGQIGRFKEGIQFISNKQIENVKKVRR